MMNQTTTYLMNAAAAAGNPNGFQVRALLPVTSGAYTNAGMTQAGLEVKNMIYTYIFSTHPYLLSKTKISENTSYNKMG